MVKMNSNLKASRPALTREHITPGSYVLVGPHKFTGAVGMCNAVWRVAAVNDQCVVVDQVDVTGTLGENAGRYLPWFRFYDFYDAEGLVKQLKLDRPQLPALEHVELPEPFHAQP